LSASCRFGGGEDEFEIKQAPIHDVQVIFAESFPVQVFVSIKGGLADSWTFRRYRAEDIWAFRPVKAVTVPEPTAVAAGSASAGRVKPTPAASADGSREHQHPVDFFIQRKYFFRLWNRPSNDK